MFTCPENPVTFWIDWLNNITAFGYFYNYWVNVVCEKFVRKLNNIVYYCAKVEWFLCLFIIGLLVTLQIKEVLDYHFKPLLTLIMIIHNSKCQFLVKKETKL